MSYPPYGPPGYQPGPPGYQHGPPGYQQYPAPGYPAPGYPAPGYPAPGYPAPGYSAPGYPAPGYPAPGYPAPGYPAPGYQQGPGYAVEWIVAPHVTKYELKRHRDHIFKKYDRDWSGYLNHKELYFALCELFALLSCPPPPEAYVWQILAGYDRNGDGRMSHKEFKKFTKHLCRFEVKKRYY